MIGGKHMTSKGFTQHITYTISKKLLKHKTLKTDLSISVELFFYVYNYVKQHYMYIICIYVFYFYYNFVDTQYSTIISLFIT